MLDNILNRVRPERKYSQEDLKKRLPPGQSLTEKWPVLHYGGVPHTPLDKWNFRVFNTHLHEDVPTRKQIPYPTRTSSQLNTHNSKLATA